MRRFPHTLEALLPALAGLAVAGLIGLAPRSAPAVEGLSSGKCILPWARSLDKGTVELESALEFSTYDHGLDNYHRVDLQGVTRDFGLGFRVTAGLTERLEMGAVFGVASSTFDSDDGDTLDESDTSLSDPALGWKYRLLGHNHDASALALEWGIGLPLVSEESYAVWEAGLIFTRRLIGPLSVDADGTYWVTSENSPGDPEVGANYNLGLGLELDGWTLAAELNGFWFRTRRDHLESWKITPTAGFSYGVSDRVCFSLIGQQDVAGWGRNTELASTVQTLFTFNWES